MERSQRAQRGPKLGLALAFLGMFVAPALMGHELLSWAQSQGNDPHANEPAVLRLYDIGTVLTNYRTGLSPDQRFAPLPTAMAAVLARTPLKFKYISETTFAHEFVPPDGVPFAPGAKIYRLDDAFLCVFELAQDWKTYKVLVVNWVGPAAQTHYVVWKNGLADGNLEGTFEGYVTGLDSRTTGKGTLYTDRIYGKQKRP